MNELSIITSGAIPPDPTKYKARRLEAWGYTSKAHLRGLSYIVARTELTYAGYHMTFEF